MHGVKCLEDTCLGGMFGYLSWGELFGRMSECEICGEIVWEGNFPHKFLLTLEGLGKTSVPHGVGASV